MVKVILLISISLLAFSCSRHIDDLILGRSEFSSEKMMLNGYYFSDIDNNGNIAVAIFYRNGVLFHLFFGPASAFTLAKIENEFLFSKEFMHELVKNEPYQGVFRLDNANLEFEYWDFGYKGITTYTNKGQIINDSTFIIKEVINNGTQEVSAANLTYHFKPLHPKPDSSTIFIK